MPIKSSYRLALLPRSLRSAFAPARGGINMSIDLPDNLGLTGRRALVTGGTRGIGDAVVTRLREAGARVLNTARSTPAEISEPELFVAADVATPEGCARVADAVR